MEIYVDTHFCERMLGLLNEEIKNKPLEKFPPHQESILGLPALRRSATARPPSVRLF